MRPALSTIQETLTPHAASVIKTAYAEAKRRHHCSVAPLHVAAILILHPSPSCPLRHACIESHKEVAHPLQCRALECCFRVALDAKPSNAENSRNPSISNALVAALKRAQAQQRRGTPEQSLQPLLAVKVEMEQLMISILDDPSVSKVFNEAKFDSTAVKIYMEEAVAQASLTGSPSPLDNTCQLMRRGRLPIPTFSASLESGQFRHSLFSSSSMFPLEPPSDHGGRLERGRMGSGSILDVHGERESSCFGPISRQEADVSVFSPLPPPFLENASPLQKRLEQTRMPPLLGRAKDSASLCNPGQGMRNIADVLLRDGKKRNPVLVSETNSSATIVMREFAQWLKKGDVPAALVGIQVVNLPVTSLSVGLLSQEETEQKFAQLRRTVEDCVNGGAIIVVGDLLWLVEAAQSDSTAPRTHAHIVVRELEHLMSSHENDRLWFLASASPHTLVRCQSNHPSLESQWGLQPVTAAPSSVAAPHHRYGSNQQSFGSPAALKLSGSENGPEISKCCPECTRTFQEQWSRIVKEEHKQSLLGGSSAGSSGMEFNGLPILKGPLQPWLQGPKDLNRASLLVKEEKFLLTQKMQELEHKFYQQCISQHQHYHRLHSGSITTASSAASIRDSSSSPVSEISSLPKDVNSRMMQHPLLANSVSKWVPEPMKTLAAKSLDLPPPQSAISKGNAHYFLLGNSASKELHDGSRGGRPIDESCISFGMIKRDGDASPSTYVKPSIMGSRAAQVCTPPRIGTDLALGRAAQSGSRDPREDGQQLPFRAWQVHGASKFEPWHDARFSLPRHAAEIGPSPISAALKPSTTGMIGGSNADTLNGLWQSLGSLVPWQKEAVTAVASAVAKCRSGEGRRRGLNLKSDTWLMLLGPDRVGKREVAKALAKVLFGCERNLIRIECKEMGYGGLHGAASSMVIQRGKTPLDRLVDDVREKPFSVLLLEDVDQADPILRRNLLRAMDRGKLADSKGREVNLANVIAIMTCSAGASFLTNDKSSEGKRAIDFDEENLVRVGSRGVRLLIEECKSVKVLHRKGARLSVVDCTLFDDDKAAVERVPEERFVLFGSAMFKRKAQSTSQDDESLSTAQKRCKKERSSPSKGFALDLNLSAEENVTSEEVEGPCTTEDGTCERQESGDVELLAAKVIQCAREALPKEIFGLVDATVIFKPFNLHALADWVLEKLDGAFQNFIFDTDAAVEIDVALLEQMVSSAWQTFSDPAAFQGWVDDVLLTTVSGLQEKSSTVIGTNSVVKLILERDSAPEFPDSAHVCRSGLLLPTVIQVVGQ